MKKMPEKDSYMEEAYEMLKHMSVDEKKRLEYEAREKAVRDYHSQMQGMREEDFAEGKEQGKKARKMRKVTSIITNMLRKGKSPEEIADLTGEELEEILGHIPAEPDQPVPPTPPAPAPEPEPEEGEPLEPEEQESDGAVMEPASLTTEELEHMAVVKLRAVARQIGLTSMTRKEIRFAKKEELLAAITAFLAEQNN